MTWRILLFGLEIFMFLISETYVSLLENVCFRYGKCTFPGRET